MILVFKQYSDLICFGHIQLRRGRGFHFLNAPQGVLDAAPLAIGPNHVKENDQGSGCTGCKKQKFAGAIEINIPIRIYAYPAHFAQIHRHRNCATQNA